MGRIRTIKPEWLDDERFNACSDAAIRMSNVLLSLADDEGRIRASFRALGLAGWKFCDRIADKTTHAEAAVLELVEARWLIGYETEGYQHWQIRNFLRHQKISHPTPSRLPPPPESSRGLQNAPESSGVLPTPPETSGAEHEKIEDSSDSRTLRSPPESSRGLRPDLGSGSGIGSGVGSGSARAPEAPPTAPKGGRPALEALSAHEAVQATFSEMRQAAGGAPYSCGYGGKDYARIAELAEWCEARGKPWHEDRAGFLAPLRTALAAFFADPRAAEQKWPIGWFGDRERYLAEGASAVAKAESPEAKLREEQRLEQERYQAAINDGRDADARAHRARVEKIAAQRRRLAGAQPSADRRTSGPRRALA